MQFLLRRGSQDSLVDVPNEKLTGSFRGSDHKLETDLTRAIEQALIDPLDAPPLASAIVPDDTVAIVVDTGLTNPEQVLVPLLEYLVTLGIEPARIKIVGTQSDAIWLNRLADRLPDSLGEMELVQHDPSDAARHAYLASTRDGRRVYLNRQIVDSDTFLVVGRTGFDSVVGLQGTSSHLFPSLGNADAHFRSRQLAAESSPQFGDLRQRQGCDEVAWLAGLFYSLGVAVNRDNQIEAVWFGHYESVQRTADEYTRKHWLINRGRGRRPELVVASLAASEKRASWQQVAAAIEVASTLVASEGSIAVVTDLNDPPGPAGRILMENDSPWNSLAKLRESRSGDPLPMTQCARAMSVAKLYLHADLDPQMLERMAIAPIASTRELQHLIEHSASCLVLEDADRFRVNVVS